MTSTKPFDPQHYPWDQTAEAKKATGHKPGPAHQNLDARFDESVTSFNGSDGVVAWGARRVASDVGRSQSWMTWGVSLWRDCGFALAT